MDPRTNFVSRSEMRRVISQWNRVRVQRELEIHMRVAGQEIPSPAWWDSHSTYELRNTLKDWLIEANQG